MDRLDKGEEQSDTELPTHDSETEADAVPGQSDLPYVEQYRLLGTTPPEVKLLGSKIAGFLENLVTENEGIVSCETLFDMKAQPKISLEKYVQRISDFSRNSAESWIIALVLLQRYSENKPAMVVHRLNLYK